VRLGELRRRQGRLDEAMALFDRSGSHPLAILGRASVALDRGDFAGAGDLAERLLRRLPVENRTERASALELMVRVSLEAGASDGAERALAELREIASVAGTAPLRAGASVAAGLAAVEKGDPEGARTHMEDAVDLFSAGGAPFETARARLALASILKELGRTETAVAEARRAIEDLTPLGADLEIERAQTLVRELTSAPEPSPVDAHGLTARQVEILRLIGAGLNNQAIAGRLFISEHTVHRHVANLLTRLDVSSRSAAVAKASRLGLL
jgi:ATP/maltotriose-dependent transcriptional regulator MalT